MKKFSKSSRYCLEFIGNICHSMVVPDSGSFSRKIGGGGGGGGGGLVPVLNNSYWYPILSHLY